MTILQPAIPGVPENKPTPAAYCSAAQAQALLADRYNLTIDISEGNVLSASMALDREAPFLGVKLDIQQEREWPRTFLFGWPNILSTPTPTLIVENRPGAWLQNYEGVVPQQVLDWVALECFRVLTLPTDRAVEAESVTGASVKYGPAKGVSGWTPSQIDELQFSLLQPFIQMQAHQDLFTSFGIGHR